MIGQYGRMRLESIKEERYNQLLFSAGLEEYLIDIDDRAKEHIWDLPQPIACMQGISEELKARDQLACVGAMNASKAGRSHEIIYK